MCLLDDHLFALTPQPLSAEVLSSSSSASASFCLRPSRFHSFSVGYGSRFYPPPYGYKVRGPLTPAPTLGLLHQSLARTRAMMEGTRKGMLLGKHQGISRILYPQRRRRLTALQGSTSYQQSYIQASSPQRRIHPKKLVRIKIP